MSMPARKIKSQGTALSTLLEGLVPVSTAEDIVVQGVAMDSREVRPGYLFLACRGLRHDGHEYISAAVAQGAVAVAYEVAASEGVFDSAQVGNAPLLPVVNLSRHAGLIAERFYKNPSRALTVIGITGTNGKTSCSQFLAQALDDKKHRCGVIGTLGNGLLNNVQAGTHTTPDAVSLHRLFAQLRDAGARSVAMEVSSHALDQGRVAGVTFAGAVFTNLSRDHLDYHGDMAAYGQAKQQLFHAPDLGFAVVNGDDAYGREILANLRSGVKAVSYGLNDAVAEDIPHVQGSALRLSRTGLRMTVRTPWGEGQLHSNLLGRFNASNLLAVLAALLMIDMPLQTALQRLMKLRPVSGRMECFGGDGRRPLVVVDYAHTPDALEQVLHALREHCAGRVWCVFGCGGDRDRGKRPVMGGIAARLADHIMVTDDNPRSEDPAAITADILAGIEDRRNVTVIHDRRDAIAAAISRAGMDDVVLVAGKGHEAVQQIGAHKLPFCDQDEVRRLLAEGRS